MSNRLLSFALTLSMRSFHEINPKDLVLNSWLKGGASMI